MNELDFCQNPQSLIFWPFWPIKTFSSKYQAVSLFLWFCNLMQKIRKKLMSYFWDLALRTDEKTKNGWKNRTKFIRHFSYCKCPKRLLTKLGNVVEKYLFCLFALPYLPNMRTCFQSVQQSHNWDAAFPTGKHYREMTFDRTEACLELALLLMIDPSFPTKKSATDLHQPGEQWLSITKVYFQLLYKNQDRCIG